MYQVNFLPWRDTHIAHQKRKFTLLMLTLCFIVVISCAYTFNLQRIEILNLNATLGHKRQQQKQMQQLKQQQLNKHQQLDTLTARKKIQDKYMARHQALLLLLRTLPSLTPTKSWLSSLSISEEMLEIKAHSYHFKSISKIPHRLNQHHLFRDVYLKKLSRVNTLNHLHLSVIHQEKIDE